MLSDDGSPARFADYRELVIEDQAHEIVVLTDEVVDALIEAATYRRMLLLSLDRLHTLQIRQDRSEAQIKQLMGVE